MKENEQKYNETLGQREKKHLDQVKILQDQATVTLNKKNGDHQKELR